MKTILGLLFMCFWLGVVFWLVVIFFIFIVNLMKALYRIYFAKNEIDHDLYNGKLN